MTVPNIPSGDFVLPVCVSNQSDIVDLLSALDLYRKLRKKSEDYPIADAVYDALQYTDNPQDSPCLDIEGGTGGFNCETFDTYSEAMHFYPNDPFLFSQDNPNLYLEWVRWGDVLSLPNVPEWLQIIIDTIGQELSGYEENDCLLVPNLMIELNPIKRIENFLDQFTNFPLPTITIVTEGAGTIGVELLNVPLGGRALVLRDIDLTLQEIHELLTDTTSEGNEGILNSFSLVELNRDLTSIPLETASTQIQEYEFTEDDENTLRIIFLPAFNDEIPFVFPFGGIRSFRACGNIQVKSFSTGEITTRFKNRQGVISVATEQDFYDALIRYENQRAKRWLLGQDGNIESGIELSSDTDYLGGGSGSGGGITVVPSKSAGSQNLTSSSRDIANGQAYGIAENFIALLNRVKSWRNSGLTQLEIEQRLIDLYHITNPSQAMTTYFAGAINDLVIPTVDQLAQDVYESASNAIGIAENAYRQATEASRNILIDFGNAVGENLGLWEAQGEERPRDEWRSYPSTLLEPVSFEFTPTSILAMVHNASENLAYESTQLFTAGSSDDRLARIEISGLLTDSDGKTFDGVSLETGTETALVGLRFCDYSGGSYNYALPTGLLPSPSQKVNGKYGYNVLRTAPEKPYLFFGVNSAVYNRNWVSGSLSIEIFDLGVPE